MTRSSLNAPQGPCDNPSAPWWVQARLSDQDSGGQGSRRGHSEPTLLAWSGRVWGPGCVRTPLSRTSPTQAPRVLAGGCCHVPLAQGGRPGEGSEASVESRPGLDPGEGSPLGSPGPSVMGTPEDSGVRTGWGHSHTTDSVPVGGAGVSRSRARAALPAGLPGGLSLRPTPHSLTLATGYPLPTRGSLSVSVPCP